jgi:phosphoglycerate dehydrogenase-like enzyme
MSVALLLGDALISPAECVVAVVGTSPDVPLLAVPEGCQLRFITSREQLTRDAADADVVFTWEPRLDWMRVCWGWSSRLRWIAAASAGVDWLMFPALVESDVVVTNSAGIFDAPMAEYALALVSAVCAGLPATIRLQARREWLHRETRRLAGSSVLVLGAGGIGRAIARLVNSVGADARCLARTARTDPEVGPVAGLSELPALLSAADFVVLALPLTPATAGIISAAELGLMRDDAWIVNLGRGRLIDEPALVAALTDGSIGGAALDVFTEEPLPPGSPLWDLPNVIVSPHMSGDSRGWDTALTSLFLDQLKRYLAGQPLRNVVDKHLGFVPTAR